jgi:hypothetical protein
MTDERPSKPLSLVFLGIILGINFLDVTTSVIPSPADHLWPIPEKPVWMWCLQVGLVVPFLWIMKGPLTTLGSTLRDSQIPRPALYTVGLFVLTAATHVSLRYESFPFSPVAMFSSGVTPRTDNAVKSEGYVVVDENGGVTPFAPLIEGSSLFGRYGLDWDYKSGWAVYIYGYVQSHARDELKAELAARGYPHVVRTRYVYDRRTGEVLWPKLTKKAP